MNTTSCQTITKIWYPEYKQLIITKSSNQTANVLVLSESANHSVFCLCCTAASLARSNIMPFVKIPSSEAKAVACVREKSNYSYGKTTQLQI